MTAPETTLASSDRAAPDRASGQAPSVHFADRLIDRVRALGHPLCAGLDPHLDRVAPLFRRGSMRADDPATVEAVSDLLHAYVDRLEGRVAIVKPQIAFFERLGWRGIRLLHEMVDRVRRLGILVLLDAKRGDIGSTARGYADAYLGDDAPLRCDAVTVAPYLGLDSLTPFLDAARADDAGIFVLVKTSNPGSEDFQDLAVVDGDPTTSGAEPLFERVASVLAPSADGLRGPATGWSSLGVVVGATWPGQAERVREALPHSLFLVPGFGTQGGSADDAVRGFVPGPSGLEGGVVNSSRGLLFPPAAAEADDAASWDRAIDDAIDRSIEALSSAVGR